MALWQKPDGTKLETELDIAAYIIELVRGETFYPGMMMPEDKGAKQKFYKDCAAVEKEHVAQLLRRMHEVGKLQQMSLTQNVYATLASSSASMETLATAVLKLLPGEEVLVKPAQNGGAF